MDIGYCFLSTDFKLQIYKLVYRVNVYVSIYLLQLGQVWNRVIFWGKTVKANIYLKSQLNRAKNNLRRTLFCYLQNDQGTVRVLGKPPDVPAYGRNSCV